MTTYNSFIDRVESFFATPHLQIKRFEEGFYFDMTPFMSANQLWPVMYMVPQEISHLQNSVSEYNMRVYFLDLLEKDESNERDVLSDQQQSARDFTNWLRENQGNGFNLLRDPRSIPVKSIGVDWTCGWYVDMSIEVETEMSECTIPFDGNFPPAPLACPTFQALSETVVGCDPGDIVQMIGYAPTGSSTSDIWQISYIYIAVDGTVVSNVQSISWDDRYNGLAPCP